MRGDGRREREREAEKMGKKTLEDGRKRRRWWIDPQTSANISSRTSNVYSIYSTVVQHFFGARANSDDYKMPLFKKENKPFSHLCMLVRPTDLIYQEGFFGNAKSGLSSLHSYSISNWNADYWGLEVSQSKLPIEKNGNYILTTKMVWVW